MVDINMDTFLITFLTGVLVVAVIQDLRYQRIPNLLTYPAMAGALAYHSITHGLNGAVFGVGGLALGIATLIVPYLMGGMGAGDAKLMGAVGAVVGTKGVFVAFLFTAIFGGIYALIVLLINRQYAKGFIARHATTAKTLVFTGQFIPIPDKDEKKKPKLCYGVAIALGTFIYMFLELSGHMWIN
jgi:prepilin peptidase CpaA